MKRRILALILAAVTLLAVGVPALGAGEVKDSPQAARLTDPASLDMSAPTAQARALVEKAMSYKGMTRAQAVAAGLPLYNGNWCASFVGLCAKAAGLGHIIPYSEAWPNEKRMYQDVLAAGGRRVASPQVGDLAFFDFNDSSGFVLEELKHVAIVCGIDRSTGEIYMVQGNAHTGEAGGYTKSLVCAVGADCPFCGANSWSLRYEPGDTRIAAYVRPDWGGAGVKNGIYEENGQKYYYENGVKKAGIFTVDGKKYYFGLDYAMKTGLVQIDAKGTKYYFAKDGHMLTGWINGGAGKRYYAGPTGALAKGLTDIGGATYYFSVKTCCRLSGTVTVDDAGHRCYFSARQSGKQLRGLITVDNAGNRRYFSAKTGYMLKGLVTTDNSGTRRYFDPKTGYMVKNRYVTVGGVRYYADASGVVRRA